MPAAAGGLSGVGAMVSRLQAQCSPVEHVDPNRLPVIEHTALVNHEDDWDFAALNPNDYEGELERLFGDWTVQSLQPFSQQQLLWIPATYGGPQNSDHPA